MSRIKQHGKAILSSALCLCIVCLVVTIAVAGTHYLTNEQILAQQQKSFEASMRRLLPGDRFEQMYIYEEENASIYRAYDREGLFIGYLISTQSMGYGGFIQVLTAIVDEKVYAVEIVDIGHETPGLGTQITQDAFLEQFIQKKESEVQAITGATISSNAVIEAVNTAMDLYFTVRDDPDSL